MKSKKIDEKQNESETESKKQIDGYRRLASTAKYLIALLVISSSVNYMPVFRQYYIEEYGHNVASVVGLAFALLLDFSLYIYFQYYLMLREDNVGVGTSIHAVLLIVSISIIFYLHFLFYSQRGDNIYKSIVSSAIFPLVIIILTFISKAKVGIKSNCESEMQVQSVAIESKNNGNLKQKKIKSNESKAMVNGNDLVCPGCNKVFSSVKAFNGHGVSRCLDRNKLNEVHDEN